MGAEAKKRACREQGKLVFWRFKIQSAALPGLLSHHPSHSAILLSTVTFLRVVRWKFRTMSSNVNATSLGVTDGGVCCRMQSEDAVDIEGLCPGTSHCDAGSRMYITPTVLTS